jgi:dihydroflavonol-4-reductase
VHSASPVPYREPPKDVGLKVIKTAVEGVLSVLRAAEKDGNVKRVVLTSSIAAVRDFAPEKRLPPGTPYTEECWSDIEYQEKIARYKVSKTLQEKAAWEYVKNMAPEKKIELVVLNPSLLVGKSLVKNQTNTAIEMLQAWFLNRVPAFHSKFSWVSASDVARAHLLAVKVKEAAGHRFILN